MPLELRIPTGAGATLDVHRDVPQSDGSTKHEHKRLQISRGNLHSDWVTLLLEPDSKVKRLTLEGDPKGLAGSPVVTGLTDLAKGGGWTIAEDKPAPKPAPKAPKKPKAKA